LDAIYKNVACDINKVAGGQLTERRKLPSCRVHMAQGLIQHRNGPLQCTKR